MFLIQRVLFRIIQINNWVLFWASATLVLVSTFIMYSIEPETFNTPFNSFWWVMTTVTTVGYGDYYPSTIAGKLFAIFLYIVGIGLIGVVIGKVIDGFGVFRKRREEGRLDYKGKDHIIIIGWSKKAEFAIKEILETDEEIEVVLIDLLEKTPFIDKRVFYVQGSASDQRILRKANIPYSKSVIIFTDGTITDSQLADGKSLLIATAVERMATNVHTTVEILQEEHIQNFQHVQVDEFVLTHETISRMAVRSAFTKGISTVYSQLMSQTMGEDLFQISPNPLWKTYRDAFKDLLNEGATLIADRNRLDINRCLDEPIPKDASLFIICDKSTYLKISTKHS